jgi:hypothetical protein
VTRGLVVGLEVTQYTCMIALSNER